MTQLLQKLQPQQIQMLLTIIDNDKLFEYVQKTNGYIQAYTLRKFIKDTIRQGGYPPLRNGTHDSNERVDRKSVV